MVGGSGGNAAGVTAGLAGVSGALMGLEADFEGMAMFKIPGVGRFSFDFVAP